jgi:RHH-type proline utilization regulon transcriptional repressor/proline dehydrogenase/delta 1-pyrroline-5-carboxylate dehydrogenase
VAQIGAWVPEGAPTELMEPEPHVRVALAGYSELIASESDREWLRLAVGSDAAAWAGELGREVDRTGLSVESNVHRHRPLPAMAVRAGHGASPVELVRVLLAAELVGTPVRVSLDATVASALELTEVRVAPTASPAGLRRLNDLVDAVESAAEFVTRVRSGTVTGRVRVIGDDGRTLPPELAGEHVTVVSGPVLATGRRELLTVLREQSISRTRHRFGHLPRENRA